MCKILLLLPRDLKIICSYRRTDTKRVLECSGESVCCECSLECTGCGCECNVECNRKFSSESPESNLMCNSESKLECSYCNWKCNSESSAWGVRGRGQAGHLDPGGAACENGTLQGACRCLLVGVGWSPSRP